MICKKKILVLLVVFTLLFTGTSGFLSSAEASAPASFVSVSIGQWFSVALKSDGTVWAAGRNEDGQLGVGDKSYRSGFVRVLGLANVVAVSAGESHGVAL